MKRLLIGTSLAALAMFVWGFVYWAALPLPWTVLRAASDEPALASALSKDLPASGAYVLPHPLASSQAESTRRTAQGPIVTLLFRREGRDPMDPMIFVEGFVHMWLSALLLGLLLRRVRPATTVAALGAGLLAALAITFWTNLGRPIWFAQPWDYHILLFCYDFGGAALAAVVLAPFCRASQAGSGMPS